MSTPLPALATQAPPGMVLYDHPVYSHGKRILWHGAWRGHGQAARMAAKEPAPAPVPAPAKVAPPAPTNPPPAAAAANAPPAGAHGYSILIDSEDSTAARLAGEFVAALRAEGLNGRVVAGSTSPAGLAEAVKGDRADLALTAMDALEANDEATADWRERAPYIARVGAETVEIVTAKSIVDLHQLAGRSVGFGGADGAAAATATTLFSRLGIVVKPSFTPLAPALADLAAGKLDAVVAVGAKSSQALAEFGKDGRFHEVSIPWTPALRALYAPTRLTAKERPNLIGANEKVDTLGAPMALIALDSAPASPRAEQSATLARAFFEGFGKLLGPEDDATWRDVNIAADAPWPRLRAAQAWIDLNAPAPDSSLAAFRAAAKTSATASGGPGPQDSERLYETLMQWRGAGAGQ